MRNLTLRRPNLPRPVRGQRRPAPVETATPREATPDVIAGSGLRWINIERPTQADGQWLEHEFGFHPLDLEDVFSRNQRAKLDTYDDYLFLVMQFPVYDKIRRRLIAAELDLFIGSDWLVTLPNSPLPPLATMFERVRDREDVRESIFAKGSGYLLYKIVDANVDASFPMLRKMGLKLEQIEDDIFEHERSAEVVRDISDLKQEIINFRKIARPQRAVLRDLERAKQRFFHEELEIYFDDISDAAGRIWDILDNYKEVIDSLDSTNESVLSHRLNDSIRILTAFSVILLPLTLIASIFGMNVALPLEERGEAFWILMGLMAAILVSLVLFFRRRGWL